MKKILILFAHPAYQKSRINKYLVNAIQNIKGVTFHDLYENYPELDIDVKFEQDLLLHHDIIVFHHPFFWYSTPAILKEWQDLVLEHGWAYGREGNALKGKIFFSVITTGGQAKAYTPEGFHGLTIRQLQAPIEKTAKLCKMIYLPPYVVHGTHAIEENSTKEYAENYRALLELLHDEKLNSGHLENLEYLNAYTEISERTN
jgi:glutathione-regulated potassium-efflux system ancillary protein KefG